MISKRMLGIGLIIFGLSAAAGLFALDFLGAGKFQGIGPAQRLALLGAGVTILIGLSLIPLGDRPA